MQIETLTAQMGVLLARIAVPANFSLNWDPVTFNKTLASWLLDPTISFPDGRIVGTTVGLCCSSLLSLQFRDESLEDNGLDIEIRRFLLASSLSRIGWPGQLRPWEHCVAGQVSGYGLIKRLDCMITPQFLAKCDRETCQVLFLLVLGAVLGAGYTSSLPESPWVPDGLSPELQRSPTLWLTMKDDLSQRLPHYLFHLGSMLGIINMDRQLEQRIIDTATNLWNMLDSFILADSKPFCYGRPRGPWEDAATSQRHFRPPPSHSRPHWEEPPPPPLPSIDCLVPISCPEASRLQSSAVDGWSQNPSSYLDMVDVPEENVVSKTPWPEHTIHRQDNYSATPSREIKRKIPTGDIGSSTGPTKTSETPWRNGSETRRRSVWLVRPYDAGPEHGRVNILAKLCGDGRAGDFRYFV